MVFSFFLHTPAEASERFSLSEVVSVGVIEEAGGTEVEGSGSGVDQGVLGKHVDHIGNEHVVASELDYLLHPALDGQRGLGDVGASHFLALHRGEACLLPLVVIGSRPHSHPIRGTGHGGSGEVDGELHVVPDHGIGVTLGAHGDIAHGRIGADGAGPGHCEHVATLHGATCDYHRREGIDHSARFP